MKSPNLEFDTMSEVNLPSYINTIDYSDRKYSKDDIDIEKGLIESEVCQICFNIIWDHMCLACPNKKCDSSIDRAICSDCSQKIFEKARQEQVDFLCPFCRTVIMEKDNYISNLQREFNNLQHAVIIDDDLDDEELVIVFNPRDNRGRVMLTILILLTTLILSYIIYVLIVFAF